jgi:hypothetical protein
MRNRIGERSRRAQGHDVASGGDRSGRPGGGALRGVGVVRVKVDAVVD